MKRLLLLAAFAAMTASAAEWVNLDDEHHLAGPKLTAESLLGKVVLVDEWGVNCPPCRRLLPQLEKYYQSFKHKPFMIVGSHCQNATKDEVGSVLKEAGVTYPVYDRVAIEVGCPDNGGSIPFMYVVNRRGKVVWSGRGEREAIEAAINAFSAVANENLLGGWTPKRDKGLGKKLVLGKSIKSELKKLAKDAKSKDKGIAADAEHALRLVEESKQNIVDEIRIQSRAKPEEAIRLMQLFMKSFPEEGKDYKAKIAELQAQVKADRKRK